MSQRHQLVLVAAFLFATSGVAFSEAPSRANYTRAELQKMVRDAHTAEQYRELAEYYRSRQLSYELRARAERHEWVRRTYEDSPPGKYPSPGDASRNRYEYFIYEAAKMGLLAARYSTMAAEFAQ